MKYLLILMFAVILLCPQFAEAHKTTGAGENHSFETAHFIKDHKLSRVSYQELEPTRNNFYGFYGNAGEKFFMEIVIPKDSGTAFFSPEIAFIGTPTQIVNIFGQLNNPTCTLEHSMSSVCRYDVNQIGYKFNDPNLVVGVPNGFRGLTFEYNGVLPSEAFYEQFSQTTFYQRQAIEFTLPETSWYWLIVYDKDFDLSNDNRYALSIGYIEDWDILSWIIDFPRSWFDTKMFTGDTTSVFAVFLGFVAVIYAIVIWGRKK